MLPLVGELAHALTDAAIPVCQWKGAWKAERWGWGVGDIDLLVASAALDELTCLLTRLGFTAGAPAPGRPPVPGGAHFFGLDRGAGCLVHVHVQSRLIVGRPWRRSYHLPLEREVLAAAGGGDGWFRTPRREHELLLLVLDAVLKQSPLAFAHAPVTRAAYAAAQRLHAGASAAVLEETLRERLPDVDAALLERCRAALAPAASRWSRLGAAMAARRALAPFAIRAAGWRRSRVTASQVPASGGLVIALDGADGAGKSTAARALTGWLAPAFATQHAHFGRPDRSLPTLAAGAFAKAVRALAGPAAAATVHAELLRRVATARDRYHLFRRVRQWAAAGGLALCERYPHARNRTLVGPGTPAALEPPATRLGQWLRRVEERYYARLAPPDLLCVLRIDPDTAVRRKPGEPAAYVRERAVAVAGVDWRGTGAHVVDARRPLDEVLADLKQRVWGAL